jgi:iron complex outermembrane receptor protein
LLITPILVAQENSTSTTAKPNQTPAQQETVIVTGTFSPEPATEIDRSVTVLDFAPQQSLYKSWVDVLETEPSLDFRQRGPNDIQGDVSIRGSSFGETLILLNGLRMDDVQSGHHDADLPLPSPSIERIEVLEGAGSMLYGSDAMAGSLNVITTQPEHSDLTFGAGVGNFGINQQYGSAAFVWKNFDESLDAGRDFRAASVPTVIIEARRFFRAQVLRRT